MAGNGKRDEMDPRPEPKDDVGRKAPDQLSPNRALRDSLGSSTSQRVGNSGPISNPVVSFPEEPTEEA